MKQAVPLVLPLAVSPPDRSSVLSVQAFQMTERLSCGTVVRIDPCVSYRRKRTRGAETNDGFQRQCGFC